MSIVSASDPVGDALQAAAARLQAAGFSGDVTGLVYRDETIQALREQLPPSQTPEDGPGRQLVDNYVSELAAVGVVGRVAQGQGTEIDPGLFDSLRTIIRTIINGLFDE